MPDPRPDPLRRAAALVFAGALLFWAADLAVLRAGTPDPLDDAWEYGVAARALLEGRGFRTAVIHPPLWELRDATLHVPIAVHGPLLPVLVAPLVATLGTRALDHLAWLAAVFAALAAAETFRLGARRFGVPVGAAAAGLFTLSPFLLRAVHHDVALAVGAWLLARALLALGDGRPLAAGAWLGAGALARPEFLFVAPLLALAAGRGAPRALGGFAACAGPWWVHQGVVLGHPFFNLSSYLLVGYWVWPELSALRDFSLTPERWPAALREALPALPGKWAELWPHAVKRAALCPSGGTGWLAATGVIAALAAAPHRAWGALAALLASVPVLVQTATVYDERYLVPFLPVFAVAAAWGAASLAARGPAAMRRPRFLAGALLLLVLPSTLPALRTAAGEARALRARLAAARAELAPHAARPGVLEPPLFSDRPDFAAWTTRRCVIWVTRPEWERLPAAGDPGRDGRPARGAAADTWFAGDPFSPRR